MGIKCTQCARMRCVCVCNCCFYFSLYSNKGRIQCSFTRFKWLDYTGIVRASERMESGNNKVKANKIPRTTVQWKEIIHIQKLRSFLLAVEQNNKHSYQTNLGHAPNIDEFKFIAKRIEQKPNNRNDWKSFRKICIQRVHRWIFIFVNGWEWKWGLCRILFNLAKLLSIFDW